MKVTIYTQNNCQHTPAEKTYLQSKNIQFEEKNVETNKADLEEMMKIGNNFAGTPVTKIVKDDGSTVVLKGFTQAEFDKELGSAAPAATAPSMPSAAPAMPSMPSVEPTPAVAMANLDVKMPDTTQPAASNPTPTPTPVPTEPTTPPQPTPPAPMPTEPTPPMPAPAEPTQPVVPAAEPTPTAPSTPPVQQANNPLDAILADLQSKTASAPTDQTPTPPAPSAPPTPTEPTTPTPPATPQTPTPAMDMPTPPAPAAGGMPSVPDFPAK